MEPSHPGESTPKPDLAALISSAASAWAQALSGSGGLSPAAKEALRATALLVLALVESSPGSAPTASPPSESASAPASSTDESVIPTAASTHVAPHLAQPALAASPSEPVANADALRDLLTKFSGAAVSARVAVPQLPLTKEPTASRTPLSLLARRADLCARACDWAIRRHDNMEDFEVVKPEYNAIREEAGSMQPLYLWMIDRETARIPRDDWVMLAGCYRNMARSAQLVASFNEGADAPIDHLRLLAEAQSMVLSALSMVEVSRDGVQVGVFEWCRDEAERRGEFVSNLSRSDMANPSLWGGLQARIDGATERCEAERSRDKALKKHLNTIRYHTSQIQVDDAADHENDWGRIQSAMQQFLEAGGKPSDPRLVDLLVPLADFIPDDLAMREGTFRRVLPFIDQKLANQARSTSATEGDRAPSPELVEARELLRGKIAVLIGGEAREPARKMLEQELELKELRWLSSREHESISSFIPDVRRSETALVLLAIRWASHSFEDVQATCNEFDKPYVRLPGGYGANRVAYEIIRQQGARLKRD